MKFLLNDVYFTLEITLNFFKDTNIWRNSVTDSQGAPLNSSLQCE